MVKQCGKEILAGGHGGLIGPLRHFAKKRRNGKSSARKIRGGWGLVGLPGLVLDRDDLPACSPRRPLRAGRGGRNPARDRLRPARCLSGGGGGPGLGSFL